MREMRTDSATIGLERPRADDARSSIRAVLAKSGNHATSRMARYWVCLCAISHLFSLVSLIILICFPTLDLNATEHKSTADVASANDQKGWIGHLRFSGNNVLFSYSNTKIWRGVGLYNPISDEIQFIRGPCRTSIDWPYPSESGNELFVRTIRRNYSLHGQFPSDNEITFGVGIISLGHSQVRTIKEFGDGVNRWSPIQLDADNLLLVRGSLRNGVRSPNSQTFSIYSISRDREQIVRMRLPGQTETTTRFTGISDVNVVSPDTVLFLGLQRRTIDLQGYTQEYEDVWTTGGINRVYSLTLSTGKLREHPLDTLNNTPIDVRRAAGSAAQGPIRKSAETFGFIQHLPRGIVFAWASSDWYVNKGFNRSDLYFSDGNTIQHFAEINRILTDVAVSEDYKAAVYQVDLFDKNGAALPGSSGNAVYFQDLVGGFERRVPLTDRLFEKTEARKCD